MLPSAEELYQNGELLATEYDKNPPPRPGLWYRYVVVRYDHKLWEYLGGKQTSKVKLIDY